MYYPSLRHVFSLLKEFKLKLKKIGIFIIALVFFAFLVTLLSAQAWDEELINGITYTDYSANGYKNAIGADQSLQRLADTGANWIGIIVTCYQEDIDSLEIDCAHPKTPTDDSVIYVIEQAKAKGLNVMLKPHINLSNPEDPNSWRGNIGDKFNYSFQWNQWFESYRTLIAHYAKLAQENGVELFCIGTELMGTTHKEQDWRNVIQTARLDYPNGLLTYAAQFDGEPQQIEWWDDDLAYIGVDAYYSLSTTPPTPSNQVPSVAALNEAWKAHVATLTELAQQHEKPIIFTEIGYQSVLGAHQQPWGYSGTNPVPSEEEQDNLYQSLLQTFYQQSPEWFAGLFLWQWFPAIARCGQEDDYTPCDKEAEATLQSAWKSN